VPQLGHLIAEMHNTTSNENPKHFVIVQFSKDSQTLIIDIFKDFYPHKPELINLIIKDHNFIFNTPYLEVKTA